MFASHSNTIDTKMLSLETDLSHSTSIWTRRSPANAVLQSDKAQDDFRPWSEEAFSEQREGRNDANRHVGRASMLCDDATLIRFRACEKKNQ